MLEGLTFDDVTLVPQFSEVGSRHDVNLTCGSHFGFGMSTPILSANMATVTGPEMCRAMMNAGGAGVLHRFQSLYPNLTNELESLKDTNFIGSIGVDENDYITRLEIYNNYKCNVVCIDVAHGHHARVFKTIEFIKENYPEMTIIAGNICTAIAARNLLSVGVDVLKVGVGSGSHCTTRVVTGHGVPQITAIMDVRQAALDFTYQVPNRYGIIADGGIRNSGDIAKALAAGADYVMVGKLLAGCKESPSEAIMTDGRLQKVYRGSASYEAQRGRRDKSTIIAEGVQSFVPYTGDTIDIIANLSSGIKSACSYSGASSLKTFRDNAQLMRVTHSSYVEGTPHGARL